MDLYQQNPTTTIHTYYMAITFSYTECAQTSKLGATEIIPVFKCDYASAKTELDHQLYPSGSGVSAVCACSPST